MLPVKAQILSFEKLDSTPIRLTKKRRRIIEDASCITVAEKVNLLALMLALKWTTDISIGAPWDPRVRKLLTELDLPFAENCNRGSDYPCGWLQVAINERVLDYIIARRGVELSTLEAGALYGYPTSHAFAFVGLIESERCAHKKTLQEHFLSGVFSEEFTHEESLYFNEMWNRIASASPYIAKLAEGQYRDYPNAQLRLRISGVALEMVGR